MTRASAQFNPGFSITPQVIKKVHSLIQYSRNRWSSKSYYRRALSNTHNLKNSRAGHDALVIANGHSTNQLDPLRVLSEMQSGLDVFAVNYFLLSELGQKITPTHYVLSDPLMHPDSKYTDIERLWRLIDDNADICLAVPHNWYPNLKSGKRQTVYLNDLSLEGWTKNITPTKPRGFLSLTAYKALALAVHLGYENIYIIGFDNTAYLNISVNENNQLITGGDTHFYSNETPEKDISQHYPQGMFSALFHETLCMLDLQRCFSGAPIINLDVNSNSASFRKIADPRFIKLAD